MKSRDFLNVVAYSNGHDDLIKIAKKIKLSTEKVIKIAYELEEKGIITLKHELKNNNIFNKWKLLNFFSPFFTGN